MSVPTCSTKDKYLANFLVTAVNSLVVMSVQVDCLKAKEEGEFMGIAAGTLKRSNDMYKSMGSLIKGIDSSYSGNYLKKMEQ